MEVTHVQRHDSELAEQKLDFKLQLISTDILSISHKGNIYYLKKKCEIYVPRTQHGSHMSRLAGLVLQIRANRDYFKDNIPYFSIKHML